MAQLKRFPLVSLMALGFAMPAMAQTAPATSADSANGPQVAQTGPQAPAPQAPAADQSPQVIIVTANKREESVQDIAVAVTAISSQKRDEIGLQTMQDYTNFAPGLTYSTANDRIGMRGISRNTNNFGIRSGISNYLDGVYLSSSVPGSREPIFVDRVEVVRGPQGTLYGRDSIGGALNVISKRPTDTYQSQVDVGWGNYDTGKIEGVVSGPITDSIRFLLGGARNWTNQGFLDNVAGGPTEGNRNDGYFLEGELAGNITDKFDWFIRGSTLRWSKLGQPGGRTSAGSRDPYDTRLVPPGAISPNSAFGFVTPGEVQIGNVTTNPTVNDRFQFNAGGVATANLPQEQEFATEATYHAPWFDVKYVGGYTYYKYNLTQDLDNTPVVSFPLTATAPAAFSGLTTMPNLTADYTENRGWFSNEINIVSTGDSPFQWITGLYQYQENFSQPSYVYLTDPTLAAMTGLRTTVNPLTGATTGVVPEAVTHFRGQANTAISSFTNNNGLNNSYGAFAQGDYQITSQFKATLGLRWSEDVVNQTEEGRLWCYEVSTCGGLTALDITDTTWFGVPAVPAGSPAGTVSQPSQGVSSATAANPSGGFDEANGNRERRLHDVWTDITGTAGLDWTPQKGTLVFVKYSRGYKPGGFGAAGVGTNFAPFPRVDKETLDNYEFGFKHEFDALHLTTDADLYYYDYKGYQVPNVVVPPVGPAFSSYVNLPEVHTTGFELETTWSPIRDFQLLANYAYLDAAIQNSQALVDSVDPLALDKGANPEGPLSAGQQGQNLKGNILPGAPKNKFSVNGLYTWNFDDGSSLRSSLSYYWEDVSYSSVFNRFYSKVPEWDQWDGRLLWTDKSGHFTFIGYVRNMFNTLQYDSRGGGTRSPNGTGSFTGSPVECGTTPNTTVSFASSPQGTLAQRCFTITDTYRPPRTYGVELQFHF